MSVQRSDYVVLRRQHNSGSAMDVLNPLQGVAVPSGALERSHSCIRCHNDPASYHKRPVSAEGTLSSSIRCAFVFEFDVPPYLSADELVADDVAWKAE